MNRQFRQDNPFWQALHAQLDSQLSSSPKPVAIVPLEEPGAILFGGDHVLTGNADLVCERGEANQTPERPTQVWPAANTESWTERAA